MLYIQAVWQFDKTHNVNSFLAFVCGTASLEDIFFFICRDFRQFFLFYSKTGKNTMGFKNGSFMSQFDFTSGS